MAEEEPPGVEPSGSPPDKDDDGQPESPGELPKQSWWVTLKSAVAEFQRDMGTDLAASLTYYSVMALFPALLALVSLLGVLGQGDATVNAMLDIIDKLGLGDVTKQIEGPLNSMVNSSAAGTGLIFGVGLALFSASSYVGGFGRAMNRIYGVVEGRPIWKLRPLQFLITVVLIVMAGFVLLSLVLSGPVAKAIGQTLGITDTVVAVWDIAKYPAILFVVVVMVALLYWATPNVKQTRFRWLSIGSAVAILIWVVASVGFGFYVANFGKYDKTYGSLAGIIIFLLWVWLTNLALVFGGELDAEVVRARQLAAGVEAERSIQLPLRGAKGVQKKVVKREKRVARGRELREEALRHGVVPDEDASGEGAAMSDPGPGPSPRS